jgi:hypothetical protein
MLQRLRLDKLENGEPIEEKIPVEFLDVFTRRLTQLQAVYWPKHAIRVRCPDNYR